MDFVTTLGQFLEENSVEFSRMIAEEKLESADVIMFLARVLDDIEELVEQAGYEFSDRD